MAQSSINFQSSGNRSVILVYQSSFLRPEGRAVLLSPLAKSSIRIPTVAVKNALEQDAMTNVVYLMGLRLSFTSGEEKSATYVRGQ